MHRVHSTYSYEQKLLWRSIRKSVNHLSNVQRRSTNMERETLAHTYSAFAPKFRRQIVYGRIKSRNMQNSKKPLRKKRYWNYRRRVMPRPHPYAIAIPPKHSVSWVGCLKGKSSLMIFGKFANMKYKYGNRRFWWRGDYVDMVWRNQKGIEEYIRNQLLEDCNAD